MNAVPETGVEARATVGVFRAVRQFWWMVLAALVLGMGLGLGVSSTQPTEYRAVARVLLTYTDNPDAQRNPERHLLNEVERMRSPEVLSLTADSLADGTTVAQLRSATSVNGAGDLDLIRVAVTTDSAERSAAWANAIVAGYEASVIEASQSAIQRSLEELRANEAALIAQIEAANAQLAAIRTEAEAAARLIYRYADDIRDDVELRLSSDAQHSQLSSRVESDEVALADIRTAIVSTSSQLNLVNAGAEITDMAKVPSSPSQPKPARNAAVGALLGLMVGTALAWWRADSLAPVDGAGAAIVLGAPQYGILPAKRRTSGSGSGDVDLSMTSALSAAGRVVATALAYRSRGERSTTILVSSVWRGEGRTLTTLATGMAFARSGRTVLLVDGDPEERGLSKACSADGAHGITEVSEGRLSVDDALYRLPYPGVPSAWLIPAGSAQPTHAPRAADAIESVSRRMDFVLVDGPPLLTSPDAIEMAADVDGVVLVVTRDTSTADLEEARRRLELVDARLLGFVMNPAKATVGSGGPRVQEMRTLGEVAIAELAPPKPVIERIERHRSASDDLRGQVDDATLRGEPRDRNGSGNGFAGRETPREREIARERARAAQRHQAREQRRRQIQELLAEEEADMALEQRRDLGDDDFSPEPPSAAEGLHFQVDFDGRQD